MAQEHRAGGFAVFSTLPYSRVFWEDRLDGILD